ncbi:MAG TPA: FtsX-like permease family protein [Acidobacteriaceae bacterium]|jgi:putative ABC transport system permease protein
MPSLSYATASHIATRELHASRGKFFFVILSVAIGVAALTGVRGFSASFRQMLLLRARSIMAADVSARTSQQPTADQQTGLDKVTANGTDKTQVTELVSMASSATSLDPMLVSVKAVDPAKYPFYGEVVLQPSEPLPQALTENSVAVGDDLLFRLHMQLGDSLKLGTRTFRIAAVVMDEPDRLSGSFAVGPRVLISQAALAQTGLLTTGSRANRRYLFKLPALKAGAARSDADVSALKSQLETLLPEAQISEYREANPALTRGLDGATSLLSLMSLVALVLGAVGVAMAMRAHLQQRLDSIAIMKSLGARSGQVMKIYLMQTLMLGLGGGLLGVALGAGVQLAFPLLLAKLLHITPDFHLQPSAIAVGLGAGLLTTLLFTLPALLDIRNVRPIAILRRATESEQDPFTTRMLRKLQSSGAQLLATALILLGLATLAAVISDSALVGGIFAAGLIVALLVLLGMAALTLFLLRLFLQGTRLHLPSALRHGLSNLYRPGNPSAALLAALGLGVMQIVAVYIAQRTVVQEMKISVSNRLPNMFLVDIASDEVAGVRTLLAHLPGVQGDPEIVPTVGSRILAVDGVAAADLKVQHMPRRALQSMTLTWNEVPDAPPPGDKVTQGKWWTAEEGAAGAKQPVVAMEQNMAARAGIHLGQHITFAAQDTQFTATVVALFETDSRHSYSRAAFVLPEASLHGLPTVWYGGVHCDQDATAQLQRVLYQHYPTITVINVAATLETVRQVILQITYVIQFLAGFSIFAGIVILASAIAGTRYRRVREVVVLKTLGAARARIATIFSIEFAVLGLVAGGVGVVFANVLARFILVRAIKTDYHLQVGLTFGAWGITAVLAVAAGWLASHRVLGQKPLEVLREE